MPLDRVKLEHAVRAPTTPVELETRPTLPALRTVADLYGDPSLATFPPEVVPYIARRGCTTLLAGAPKMGKTTLVLNALAAHVARVPFLGSPVQARRWLWLSLDEPEPILIHRLRRLGVPEDTDDVRFLLRRDLDRTFTPAVLKHYLLETGADVVVWDTLGRVAQAHAVDITKGDQVLPWITPYIEVIRSLDAAAIILAHTTKDGQKYKGAIELEGEVDAPVLFKRRGERDEAGEDSAETSSLRRLEGMTRWGEVLVDVSSPDGLSYVVGDGDLSLTDRVLAALRASDIPIATAALAKRLGRRRQDVQHELGTLESSGRARRSRGGWLAVPTSRSAPPRDREWDREETPPGPRGRVRTGPGPSGTASGTETVPRSGPRDSGRDRVPIAGGPTGRVLVVLDDGTSLETRADDPELAVLTSRIVRTEHLDEAAA